MREIGSEYSMQSCILGKNHYKNLINYPKRYVLSGRTGLFLIASELKSSGVSTIALPAYCCSSMIEPFIKADIKVSFYEKDEILDVEVILIMDYFGFLQAETVELAKASAEKGLKVVVDATQTAFSKSASYKYADYILVSYRKWFDCLCAAVYSKNGFATPEYTKENVEFRRIWRLAAKKKSEYLKNGLGDKQEFLELFSTANKILKDDYIGYCADRAEVEYFENVDSTWLRSRRRENAATLLNDLSGKINFMFTELCPEDCPLFVPALLFNENRDKLRGTLIGKSIYCPCHWPINTGFPYQKTLFHEQEISLICDQRYSPNTIKFEAEQVLKNIIDF
ncbi:MAG: hypothetical protein HUJ54_10325 [Erysipelotrichaceae bacterium]|nr:hypothetical protein [Erysipelotrichaceae bacterium]